MENLSSTENNNDLPDVQQLLYYLRLAFSLPIDPLKLYNILLDESIVNAIDIYEFEQIDNQYIEETDELATIYYLESVNNNIVPFFRKS